MVLKQAAEVMLYTVDKVNAMGVLPPPLKLGAYVLDDCDKDTYGLQQAVDFIKGNSDCFLLTLLYYHFAPKLYLVFLNLFRNIRIEIK